jgi:hypothetical protein
MLYDLRIWMFVKDVFENCRRFHLFLQVQPCVLPTQHRPFSFAQLLLDANFLHHWNWSTNNPAFPESIPQFAVLRQYCLVF